MTGDATTTDALDEHNNLLYVDSIHSRWILTSFVDFEIPEQVRA